MKCTKKFLVFLPLISFVDGFGQKNNYDPNHLYSPDELKSDFRYLQSSIEKKHPNLYFYTPKIALNIFFDSLYNSIDHPLTAVEFYNIITLLNSKIKDGHTMFLPGEEETNYLNKNARFFPFYIFATADKIFVTMNCSADTSIKAGAEIVSINRLIAADIMIQLIARQIRDGNNQTYPIWILTNYFKEYFGFSFGHPDSFLITYKNDSSAIQTKTIYALSKDSIRFYRHARYFNNIPISDENKGIIVETNKKLNTAILTIKSFDKEILKSVYSQNFKTSIDNAFSLIENNHINNLILDIRNNQGGDFKNGCLLLSYLLKQQIRFLADSKGSRTINPLKNNYKGNLYILVNGGTFSNTAIVSAYLESTKRGIFIGEETAGNKNIISGDPVEIILSNTKISAQISTVKYLIQDNFNDGHGIIPTYYMINDINNIILNKDIVKDFSLKLIAENRQ